MIKSMIYIGCRWLLYAVLFCCLSISQSAYAGGFFEDVWSDVSREWDNCWSGGCDVIWKANKRFDDGVRSKGRAMAEGVREVFEPAMDKLFDEQIRPLLNDIDVMVRNNWKEAVEVAFKRADQTIDRTLLKAQTEGIELINFAISKASDEFGKQRQLLIADVNKLIDVIDCAVEGQTFAIQNFIDEKLDILDVNWPWESKTDCQAQLGLGKDRKAYSNSDLYLEAKCEFSERITVKTPVKKILFVLGDLQGLAVRFQCLERKAPAAARNYSKEWLEFGRRYAIWEATQ